jgi:hypothetical protein
MFSKKSTPAEGTPGIAIDPRPGVRSIALYSRLNYDPWFAIAEFIDNSLESYQRDKAAILDANGDSDFKLQIEVEVRNHGTELSVKDNAGGIHTPDYARAFSPAAPPPDRSGLSEFGIGLKTAACWFTNNWSVTTSAIGESVQRTITWNVPEIVRNDATEIPTTEYRARENDHYTELTLLDLLHPVRGRTVTKIKEHLSEIYRGFIQREDIQIKYNGEELLYVEPSILQAAPAKNPDEDQIEWKREFTFTFGDGATATGFVALLEKISNKVNGFSLFRRGRIIEGIGENKLTPSQLFGAASTFRHRRIFGDITIEGLEVSHQKDKFNWGSAEEDFLTKIKEVMEDDEYDFYHQAEKYRVTKASKESSAKVQEGAKEAMAQFQQLRAGEPPELQVVVIDGEPPVTPPRGSVIEEQKYSIEAGGVTWIVNLILTHKPEQAQWMSIQSKDTTADPSLRNTLDIYISASHPFLVRFCEDAEATQAILKMSVAMALAEKQAIASGATGTSILRATMNDLLIDTIKLNKHD